MSDIGQHDMKHLWNGIVERMLGVLVGYLNRGWFYSRFLSGVGW